MLAAPFVGTLALSLGACKVTPDYDRPEVKLPETWRHGSPSADSASLADLAWWELFGDPRLQDLIREARAENWDLRAAMARIRQARGVRRAAGSLGVPQLGIDVATDVESDEDNRGRTSPLDQNHKTLLVAGWEIDLWGKFARVQEAALADLQLTVEIRNAIVLSLVADVAQTYFQLRELDNRLRITEETAKSRRQALRIARMRFEGGISTQLEVRQAEVELSATEAGLPQIQRQIALTEHALCVLLARPPGPIERGWSIETQPIPPALPGGLTGDLLARRPDIRAAEQELIAANARVGVALTQFYPKLSLAARAGLETDRGPENLFDPDALLWGATANLFAPLFTAGRLEGNLESAEAEYDIVVAAFQQSILQALREVNDALISYQRVTETRQHLEVLVDASREYLRLAQLRHANGVVGYIDVIDAQRSLFESELQLSRFVREQLLAVVQLYKALGGGWVEEAANDVDA